MAAYAALVSLLNNIHEIQSHPHLSTSLDNLPIQPLLENTGLLLDFIEGNSYGAGSKEAQDLERQITSAAHAAEDLIESHIVDRIYEERRRRPYLLTFSLNFVGCHASGISKKSLDLQKISEEMDGIVKEANEFKEKHRLGEEQQPTYLANPNLMQREEATMVGLDAELNQLLDELTGYQSSHRIISIVGMGGSGKTILAKNVYKNLVIKEQFRFCAWATISQQHNAQEVLSELLSSIGESSIGTVDDLGLRLHKTLSCRRYLIIIDDIWSVQAWDEVKRFFPDNNNGSRILLTTRLSNVAEDCGSSLFMMNLLNEANSWKLFCENAFQDEDCPSELREVGEEIVRLCNGLALSIVVIGGFLRKSPKTVGYWKCVEEDLKSITNSKEKQESLDVLSFSYNHLPPHLKPCFLYMGVFKENSKIRVSRIIKLWVAEGFIKQNGSQVLEEIANTYINDMIDRNLILVYRRCKNGEVGFCGIHDLLRDLCIKLAEQEEFFHVRRGGKGGMERRLIDGGCIGRTKVRLPLTLSIMTQGCIKPSAEYKLMRVVDRARSKSLANYYAHVNLRYLAHDFRGDFKSLQKLPSSISFIWNLETLIIKNVEGCLIVMPVEIWKMRQLRHVECREMYVPDPPRSNGQDALLMLEKLQTLKVVVSLRLCEAVYRIIPNIKKLYIVYDSDLHGYDDDSLIACLCNLDRLQKLESLNLSLKFPNRELTENLIASFPRSLKELSLRRYRLERDDMTMIGSLPLLEVLQLDNLLFSGGGRWSLVDEQFLRLKFLKIAGCNLVSWEADASHFPVLEKLELFLSSWLEAIPLGFSDIPTLKFIRVTFCSNSAAISAVRIKEDRHDTGAQLQAVVEILSSADLELFNQMLETEGLTASNVDLKTYG